jgi:hypothetical protein
MDSNLKKHKLHSQFTKFDTFAMVTKFDTFAMVTKFDTFAMVTKFDTYQSSNQSYIIDLWMSVYGSHGCAPLECKLGLKKLNFMKFN